MFKKYLLKSKILHLFLNFILFFVFLFLTINFIFIFVFIYFAPYISYLIYIGILFLFYKLIKKKRFITCIYLLNFFIVSNIVSKNYINAFFNTKMNEKETIKTIENLKNECNGEENNLKNITCARYFKLFKLCQEETEAKDVFECSDYIINGSLFKPNKK